MAKFSLSNAISGVGGALSEVGGTLAKTAIEREAQIDIIKLRDDLEGKREAARQAWLSGENVLAREHAVTLERDIRQPFQRSEREAGEEAQRRIETDVRQPFQRSEREAGQTFLSGEKEKDRALEKQRIGIQGAQLKATLAQVDLAVKMGTIKLKEAERIEALHADYLAAKTPEEKDAIADQIYALTGKDRFQPVMGKDEAGNPIFMGAFNARSGRLESGAGGARGSGRDWREYAPGASQARGAPEAQAPRPARVDLPPEARLTTMERIKRAREMSSRQGVIRSEEE